MNLLVGVLLVVFTGLLMLLTVVQTVRLDRARRERMRSRLPSIMDTQRGRP